MATEKQRWEVIDATPTAKYNKRTNNCPGALYIHRVFIDERRFLLGTTSLGNRFSRVCCKIDLAADEHFLFAQFTFNDSPEPLRIL